MSLGRGEIVLEGIAVSRGLAVGQALKLDRWQRPVLKLYVPSDRIDEELARLHKALDLSRQQLARLKTRLVEKVGLEQSLILDVHLLMLEDRRLVGEIESIMRSEQANAEWAVQRASERLRKAYRSLEDEYFRDRGSEIENVVERILVSLSGLKPAGSEKVPDDIVIVARDFSPSEFASLDLGKIRGLALEAGGRTSHTAIISRSLQLPAVMGVHELLEAATSGDMVVVDGDRGMIFLNPAPERLDDFRKRIEASRLRQESSLDVMERNSIHLEEEELALLANIDLPGEVRAARRSGAQGIGLFRSEFLFFGTSYGFPDIPTQAETYRALAREMAPFPVSIRTLDAALKGSKGLPLLAPTLASGLGLRGIRRSLQEREPFSAQIAAIYEASQAGNLEILLPMVSSVQEVWEARSIIEEVRLAGGANRAPLPVGVMIEVPAAVLALEQIAGEADFLCVGTNDLIQYVLAVDRGDPEVSYLYQPLHPAILRCLKRIDDVCRTLGRPVRICGEMSANPLYAVLLVGLGFRVLSMNAFSIPAVRRLVCEMRLADMKDLAVQALSGASAAETADLLIGFIAGRTRLDLNPYVSEVRAAGRMRAQ